MIIAATRMHHSLVDFASAGSSEVYDILHFPSYSHAQRGLCCFRTLENRRLSGQGLFRTRRGDPGRSTLDHIKVSVSVDSEQCSTGLKNDSDSTTVFSTSEKIPQITEDPPKLDLTRASAHSLPTYPPPPFLE